MTRKLKYLIPAIAIVLMGAAFQYGGLKLDITSQSSSLSPIVLNNASTQIQRVTGSANQVLKLPDATTLRGGYFYYVSNESSGTLTISNSASVQVVQLPAGNTATKGAFVFLTSNSIAAGPWTYGTLGGSSGAAGFTGEVAAARHGDDCTFTNSDAGGISAFAADATCTFTSRLAAGITLSALLSGADDLPGVNFTPTASGQYYEICARATITTGSATGAVIQLWDGSASLSAQPFNVTLYAVMPFCGVYTSVGTSQIGIQLRAQTFTAGTTTISGLGLNESAIEWTVKRVK